HPDHQFRINRRPTHRRIMRCKFAAKPGQIESNVDLPHHVIFGNRIAKTKLVEQLTLVTLQTAHHGSTSPRFASTQRNHASRPLSTDFCNKIGPWRTHPARVATSAFGCKTDVALNYRRVRSGGTYFGARQKTRVAEPSAQVSTKLAHPSSQASAQQRS